MTGKKSYNQHKKPQEPEHYSVDLRGTYVFGKHRQNGRLDVAGGRTYDKLNTEKDRRSASETGVNNHCRSYRAGWILRATKLV